MSQVRAGAAYVELQTKDAAFVKGLQAAQKSLNSFASSTKLLGTKLMGLGVAAATPIAGSVAVYSNFDDAMRAVKGVTQAPVHTWPQHPPDHPYHLPPDYSYTHLMPPGHPGTPTPPGSSSSSEVWV